MGGADKSFHIFFRAEIAVDPAVIESIVFVVAWRLKNRREIQSRNAQIMKIGQTFGDAFEVAAVDVIEACFLIVTPRDQTVFFGRSLCPAKAVGHDLIPDGMFYPFRRRNHVRNVQPRKFEILTNAVFGFRF